MHAIEHLGETVAYINKQDRLAANYRREEPWLLLYVKGRTERFACFAEARIEARKSWPGCRIVRC